MTDVSSDWLREKKVPWCFREDCAKLADTENPFIINLDDKGNGGTHWVAARMIGDTLFYADPFGTMLNGYPPEELQRLAKRQVINSISWQRPSTNLCGYYAYRFTKALDKLTQNMGQKDMEHLLWKSIH
jgi:hypothetical protein